MTLTELFRNGKLRKNAFYVVEVIDSDRLPKFSIRPKDGDDETLYFTVDTGFSGETRLEPYEVR